MHQEADSMDEHFCKPEKIEAAEDEVYQHGIFNPVSHGITAPQDFKIDVLDCIHKNIFAINDGTCKASKNKTIQQKAVSTKKFPRIIAPKLAASENVIKSENNIYLESKKKKAAKRRATHNEVEKRRRDKISNWILKLKGLMPDTEITNSCVKYCKTSSTDSKSQILIRAYYYIQHIQEEVKSLRAYIQENDRLCLCDRELRHKIIENPASEHEA